LTLLVAALVTLVAGGVLALMATRWPAVASVLGVGSAIAGCALGEAHAITVLHDGATGALALRWEIPYGLLRIQTDALSAFFLVPLFGLGALAALYGGGYMRAYAPRKALGPAWLAYNALLASMVLVLVARQALLFLVAWESMVLFSYVCVTFDYEDREVARAGWVYLIASHVGTAALLALFLLYGRQAHGFDFVAMRDASPSRGMSTLLAALALLGFGVKAGFVPLHVWLPEAHAAAPSHVSALMSGVLVNMGLYGVLRTLVLLGTPPGWMGPALMGIGLAGAMFGIVLASYQRDVKRVLAYSTIENLGLITLALGVAMWGWASGRPQVAALAVAGALLHVWNHTMMKGLLFLGAGSVLHGAGTKDLERLGGVMKRMPRTGSLLVLGSVAIAGLPPLNGFVSEWLLYLALMILTVSSTAGVSVLSMLIVGGVSLVGALAGLAFVRTVGTALLGQPRSEHAENAHESPATMVAPMTVLALGCVGVGLMPQQVLASVGPVADRILGGPNVLSAAGAPLGALAGVNAIVWGAVIAGVALASWMYRRRTVASDGTWGCGYAMPTARIQYTARSFSETLSEHLLPAPLRPRVSAPAPPALFPAPGAFASDCADPMTRGLYEPFLERWADRFARLRWMQQGLLHVYLLYVLVALLVGLAWSSIASWGAG
jgi:formate hydrogenlyase subunit 3/multisubunit Na+/H+ antiporter MnhD subunit